MKYIAWLLAVGVVVSPALANFSMVQLNNSAVPAGGYLLDDAAGFIINDIGGRLIAR